MHKLVHQGQLGAAIRQLRRDQGLTQRELADKAGVSAVWLSQAARQAQRSNRLGVQDSGLSGQVLEH